MAMTRTFPARLAALAFAVRAAGVASAQAQETAPGPAGPAVAQTAGSPVGQTAPAGWTVTPSLLYSGAWDDNVLLRGSGDQTPGDLLNVVNPRADVDFNGRRGEFAADYDGAFLLYRQLSSLDSYDQHASMFAKRLISPHLALFVENSTMFVPTTDLVEFVGVPFERTGSKLDDAQGGIEAALSKHTSLTASYHFQWVQFDQSQAFASLLRGGHSNGGTMVLHHQLSKRTTFIADYDLQHAQIAQGGGVFDVQNATLGLDRRLSDRLHVFGAVGVSHLNVSSLGPAHTGPSWRAGLSRQLKTAAVDVDYSRSFLPA
jgi:hypothetical protein